MGAGVKVLTMSIAENGICRIQAHGLMEDGEYSSEEVYRGLSQLMAAGWELVKSKKRESPDPKEEILELYFWQKITD